MAKNATYTVNHHVPDGEGGYRNLHDLSEGEYDRFKKLNAETMAETLIDIFREKPEFFDQCQKLGYVTGLKRR